MYGELSWYTYDMFSEIIFRLFAGDYVGALLHFSFLILLFVGIVYLKRWKRFAAAPFEVKYFSVMIPVFLVVLAHAIVSAGSLGVGLLLVFGVLGMVMETILSWIWTLFFKGRVYYYTSDTLAHAYTSWLNFIPWCLGGWMFVSVYRLFSNVVPEQAIFYIALSTIFLLGLTVVMRQLTLNRRRNFSPTVYVSILLCFLFPFSVSVVVFGISMLWLVLALTIFGVVFEYLFGKTIRWLFGRQLWVYQFYPLDEGFSSILNIVPWGIVGICFIAVSIVLRYLW